MPTTTHVDLRRAYRTDRGYLQTAVHSWVRHGDQRTVTLVGTVHLAEDNYFDRVREFVTELAGAGAIVHFEYIGSADDTTRAALTDIERDALAALDVMSGIRNRLGEMAGLSGQSDRLRPQPTWINTDATAVEIIRLLGPRKLARLAEPAVLHRLDALSPQHRRIIGVLARFLIRNAGHTRRLRPLLGGAATDVLTGDVVLEHRNRIAVNAALDTPPGTHVVAVWGAGHLPGIGQLLAANDFRLNVRHLEWHTAITPGPRRG